MGTENMEAAMSRTRPGLDLRLQPKRLFRVFITQVFVGLSVSRTVVGYEAETLCVASRRFALLLSGTRPDM